MIALADTHVHLNDRQYKDDWEETVKRAQEAGVVLMINVGYDLPSSRRAVQMAQGRDGLYAAVGIHPHDALTLNEAALAELRSLAGHPRVVAVGEMGLDYYRDLSPREVQRKAFRQQLRLARELGKPVIIHDRDAHGDVLKILREEKAQELGGVLHCFSGSWEMAREAIKMGFYISFAGPVTYKNARRLLEVARQVPLNRLLLETDCPYLTPEPHRGRRNEPLYVALVAEKIAELRGMDLEELAAATLSNARTLFRLEELHRI
ncbi:MAG: TatD family hydrolase [Clostridia bacterium]|nr:TatD family hydrolase [Clostridia bacterium]